ARVDDITLDVEGADVSIDEVGNVVLSTKVGDIRHEVPRAYQMINGEEKPIESRFVLKDGKRIGFEVGAYYPHVQLIIVTAFIYSAYRGGPAAETIRGVSIDNESSAYVIGTTESADLPTTPGALQSRKPAEVLKDAFVAKLNPSGNGLAYCTYLG